MTGSGHGFRYNYSRRGGFVYLTDKQEAKHKIPGQYHERSETVRNANKKGVGSAGFMRKGRYGIFKRDVKTKKRG